MCCLNIKPGYSIRSSKEIVLTVPIFRISNLIIHFVATKKDLPTNTKNKILFGESKRQVLGKPGKKLEEHFSRNQHFRKA